MARQGETCSRTAQFSHDQSRYFRNLTYANRALYPLGVSHRTRKNVLLDAEVVEAAKQRGISLGDYVLQLHQSQRSSRIAYAASIYRGFALLEMARVPVDPAYFELVDGCMSAEDSKAFRIHAASGEENALPKAAAKLLAVTRGKRRCRRFYSPLRGRRFCTRALLRQRDCWKRRFTGSHGSTKDHAPFSAHIIGWARGW